MHSLLATYYLIRYTLIEMASLIRNDVFGLSHWRASNALLIFKVDIWVFAVLLLVIEK